MMAAKTIGAALLGVTLALSVGVVQARDREPKANNAAATSEAAQAWSATKDSTNVTLLRAFIRRYKGTFYSDLARARLEDLQHSPATLANAAAAQPFALNGTTGRQRAVLYEEDPLDPKGKQYVGWVVWRTEPVKASDNQRADIAARAEIEIPDRKLKMTFSFRRNTDPTLPASHTAELTFALSPGFPGGSIGNVPGMLMKTNEQARGTALAGLTVKVTDGFFLMGLSSNESDRNRNIQLLTERSWFDVPLVYANQRRAILAFEKGSSGREALDAALSVSQVSRP